ncbi:MAG: hypothetical protein ACYC6X_01620 [Minisyncoccota bacterium]
MAALYTQGKATFSLFVTTALYALISFVATIGSMFSGWEDGSLFSSIPEYYHYPFVATVVGFIDSVGPLVLIALSVYFYIRGNYRVVYGFGWIVFIAFVLCLVPLNAYSQSQITKAIQEGGKNLGIGMFNKESGSPMDAHDFLCPGSDGYFLRIIASPDVPNDPKYLPRTMDIELVKIYVDPADGVKKISWAVVGNITNKPNLIYKTGATDAEKKALDEYINSCTDNFGQGKSFSAGALDTASRR